MVQYEAETSYLQENYLVGQRHKNFLLLIHNQDSHFHGEKYSEVDAVIGIGIEAEFEFAEAVVANAECFVVGTNC